MDGFALRHVPRDDDAERSQGRQYLYALETGFADNCDSSVDSDVSFAAQHWDGADDSLAAALRPGDRLVLSRQQGRWLLRESSWRTSRSANSACTSRWRWNGPSEPQDRARLRPRSSGASIETTAARPWRAGSSRGARGFPIS